MLADKVSANEIQPKQKHLLLNELGEKNSSLSLPLLSEHLVDSNSESVSPNMHTHTHTHTQQ